MSITPRAIHFYTTPRDLTPAVRIALWWGKQSQTFQ